MTRELKSHHHPARRKLGRNLAKLSRVQTIWRFLKDIFWPFAYTYVKMGWKADVTSADFTCDTMDAYQVDIARPEGMFVNRDGENWLLRQEYWETLFYSYISDFLLPDQNQSYLLLLLFPLAHLVDNICDQSAEIFDYNQRNVRIPPFPMLHRVGKENVLVSSCLRLTISIVIPRLLGVSTDSALGTLNPLPFSVVFSPHFIRKSSGRGWLNELKNIPIVPRPSTGRAGQLVKLRANLPRMEEEKEMEETRRRWSTKWGTCVDISHSATHFPGPVDLWLTYGTPLLPRTQNEKNKHQKAPVPRKRALPISGHGL